MEKENPKGIRCTGDCLGCHPNQRAYCAAQFTFNTMRMVEQMQETVVAIKAEVDAMRNGDANVFNPTQGARKKEEKAQDGDGAKE